MRDLLVTLIVFGGLPFILARPHVGVLYWFWISYMNPHRLTFGFAYSFPFAVFVAAATLVGLVFSSEPKRMPWTSVTLLLLLFVVWTSLTTLFALVPPSAMEEWSRFIKIILFTFVTFAVIGNRERLQQLIWVVVLSLAFYGVKGGIFTLATGGQYMVLGPEGSFFAENNEMAFTLTMMFPLLRYLQLTTDSRWVRYALSMAMVFTVFSILGSYSRGALLAILAMGAYLLLKSRKRGMILVMALVLGTIGFAFMPEQWHTRMGTISSYEQDRSAMGRINAWKIGLNIAAARPIVGGGFGAYDRSIYKDYLPYGVDPLLDPIAGDVHSIYFEVLGEHGYVGILLFLALGWMVFRTGSQLIRAVGDRPELTWARDLAAMIQVSLIGYAVGGAFLGLAYFDLYYTLIAILVCANEIVKRALEHESVAALKELPRPKFPGRSRAGF